MKIIFASQISSAIKIKGKLQFEIDHKRWLRKKKPSFGDMTKALYFTHGILFEKYAIREVLKILQDKSYIPQNQDSRKLDVYEKEYEKNYLKYNESIGFHIPLVTNGVGNEEYSNGEFIVSARPDGLFDSHILEVKCPLGQLYKKRKEKGEEFDFSKEQFIIPYNYKLQMIIEMLCHKRNKGYFFQYYQPNGWKSFMWNLHDQYFNIRKISKGTRVYKPWINNDDFVLTVLLRGWKEDNEMWRFYQELAEIPSKPQKVNSAKENFEQYRDKMEFIIQNISVSYLMSKGKTKMQAVKICKKLQFGSGFKVGTVTENNGNVIKVVWDNNVESEIMYDDYREGIIHIFNTLHITRKEMRVWDPFFSNLKNGVLDPVFPSDELPIEHVLIELDMSNFIRIQNGKVETRGLRVVENFLRSYTDFAPLKQLSPLKKFLEALPINVLNVYRGKSEDQKKLEKINELLKKNPQMKEDVMNFVKGESKESLYSVDALINILNLDNSKITTRRATLSLHSLKF